MNLELGYCEIYKPVSHGILNNYQDSVKKHIYTSILFQYPLNIEDFFDISLNSPKTEWEERGPWLGNISNDEQDIINRNPYVKNTCAIKLNELQIVEKLYYNDYTFCILKTFWIKIFQRKWKKYYKKLLNKKKNLKSIINRSITGKW
jgi:hypothetical protein